MADIIEEEIVNLGGDFNAQRLMFVQHFSDGSRIELTEIGDKPVSKKVIQADGSYELYNAKQVKIEELTVDGTRRKFDGVSGVLQEEQYKDGSVTSFYANGNISSKRWNHNSCYVSYFENGQLARRQEDGYEISLNSKGVVNYEFKDGKLTINPDYFSLYRLGVKTSQNATHWEEKGALSPKKKTLLCLGGDQSKDARAANGNINSFAAVLGLTPEQIGEMQLCSCYRPFDLGMAHLLQQSDQYEQQCNIDYKREILQKFMPFMAQVKNGKLEKYSPEELCENFRNIIIQAHCYGANDLPFYSQVFKETMTSLGYSQKEQKNALRQVICITNNSQREFRDKLDFTMIHRYSVKDGQFEPEYETRFSAGYPEFLKNIAEYTAQKGEKAAFVPMKNNEVLMVFDKVLIDGSEHNAAFWTTNEKNLTEVGKQQALLMKNIGAFWYQNREDLPDVVNLLQECSKQNGLEDFVKRSLQQGKKLKTSQRNVLENPLILKSAKNRFNSPDSEPEKTGIYKLLSQNVR